MAAAHRCFGDELNAIATDPESSALTPSISSFERHTLSLTEFMSEHIRAAFSGLYLQTYEPEEALREVGDLCRRERWTLATWDIDRGLSLAGAEAEAANPMTDPLAALRSLSSLATADSTALLVLKNFQRFLGSAEIVHALQHQLALGKQLRTFVVILAPVVQLPIELERQFVVLHHELPHREQLAVLARAVATEADELPIGPEFDQLLDAAVGLTRCEAENAFALSLVRHGRLQPEVLWEQKAQALLKSGLLTLHRGRDSFTDLGGLANLKAFCLRALRSPARQRLGLTPRGVLLLGVPGTGKTAFAKALGHETSRPTLVLDVGSLFGSLVGQTEERTRQALRIVDAMAPCVVVIDEVEKALGGMTAGSGSDGGIGTRLFGALLSWLNDHTSDVFVVCTANDVAKLPPEFSRAERFDGCFFLDLPGPEQKAAIWRQYRTAFGIAAEDALPQDAGFTGAEIRACCRLAALLDVPLVQAARNVVPVSVTAAETIERLRTWASGRCLDVETAGLYATPGSGQGNKRRRVSRDPSAN